MNELDCEENYVLSYNVRISFLIKIFLEPFPTLEFLYIFCFLNWHYSSTQGLPGEYLLTFIHEPFIVLIYCLKAA